MSDSRTCRRTQQELEQLAEGRLSPAGRERVDHHLATCAACRELRDLIFLGDAADLGADSTGLLEDILEQTSGSPCGRAHELLCDRVDGELWGLDRELLDAHVLHCEGCSTLSTVMTRLGQDLPSLARLEPDAGFVASVLEATGARTRPARQASRLVRTWRGLMQRPRIAWEAAYVAAALIWLTVGPLRLPADSFSVIGERIASLSSQTWQVASSRGEGSLDELRTSVAVVTSDIKQQGRQWGKNTFNRIKTDGASGLQTIRNTTRRVVEPLFADPDSTAEAEEQKE